MPRRDRLAQVRDRLARWRAKHGGRGIRIPEGMWAEVVEVARVEGVEATAHSLQLDPALLIAGGRQLDSPINDIYISPSTSVC